MIIRKTQSLNTCTIFNINMLSPEPKRILNIMGKKNAYEVLALFYQKQHLKFSDILKEYPKMNHGQLSLNLKNLIEIGYLFYSPIEKTYNIHWSGTCFYEYVES